MSNSVSRYKYLYERMVRSNSAVTFPRHVFLRAQNKQMVNIYDRIGDREDAFETTFVHLTERFHKREVFLVGSSNKSTMLAQRTQKLIREVKPDVVLVQTNQEWWDAAKMLEYVHSQEELERYNDVLSKAMNFHFDINTRKLVYRYRMAILVPLLKGHYQPGSNFNPLLPGLEMKYACEEAERAGAKLQFLGPEMDPVTQQRIYHDTRFFNVYTYLRNSIRYCLTDWYIERREHKKLLHMYGPRAFTERCLDRYMINWMVKNLEIHFPSLKRIFVDQRDEDLFRAIDAYKGKRVVAVVNQWHMEGIEHYWANAYGQLPRSVVFPDGINPIGDMDLRRGLFNRLYGILWREIKSSNHKSTPSTYSDMIIGYHRESNWQYEHRNM